MKVNPLTQYCAELQQKIRTGKTTESTFRSVLEKLLQLSAPKVGTVNEPKRVACGAPDLWVTLSTKHGPYTIGYVETKDLDADLGDVENSEQLKRYRGCLHNLILTNYLDFRWYIDGELREKARLARPGKDGKLTVDKTDVADVEALLRDFLQHEPDDIAKPKELALRMARLTHIIRDIIVVAFENNNASHMLQDLRKAFALTLIPDLDQPERAPDFADMFAQTVAYGLFAARCNHTTAKPFKRMGAAAEIPKTNPLLRQLFETITGAALNEEPFAGFVDDLVQLLDHTNIEEVLKDFGKRTRKQDPVVHFYETFLAAYDPDLRETRGIYYTPEPVVSYIVRSVDGLLREKFGCSEGLAHANRVEYQKEVVRNGKTELIKDTAPKVLILDPACGTGTFLYSVVDQIRDEFRRREDAGMWSGYVRDHLLPRLFGFELLMAPYAVAHFKLGMQLAAQDMTPKQREKWAYDFAGDERLGVYLTNTLEEAERQVKGLFGPYRVISDEANAAAAVKRDLPILIVMGNPPYSGHSANRSWEIKVETDKKGKKRRKRIKTFIGKLLDDYYQVDGEPLGERNPKWLQDDYVKFMRWGQWRIERTGSGVLAFITNHGYLDNPTFRGMRQQLLKTFDDIYILDLHGNAKKRETCPAGSKDENVFDIQQGVAIGIFIKHSPSEEPATVHHAELWGLRKHKYDELHELDTSMTKWKQLSPKSPYHLFVPVDNQLGAEYERGWKVTEAVPLNVLGFQSHRDDFAIAFNRQDVHERVSALMDSGLTDANLRQEYALKDSGSWRLSAARAKLSRQKDWQSRITTCCYRPFDRRFCHFSQVLFDRTRHELLIHVAGKKNLCLNTVRQTKMEKWGHALASDSPAPAVYVELKDGSNVFPLYLYPDPDKPFGEKRDWPSGKDGRTPNLDPKFIRDVEAAVRLEFVTEGVGDLKKTFGPEDVFHYIYAIFHSPTYRERYAEFLKRDFPRVPLTSDKKLFRTLCSLGADLTALHLLEDDYAAASWSKKGKDSPLREHKVSYPVPGSNEVEKAHPKYLAPGEKEPGTGKAIKSGRVYIGKDKPKEQKKGQYFEGVPQEVWTFHVGGYQVCEKWLKDRRGRKLSYEDQEHYKRVVVAISETIGRMEQIDAAIPGWPIT